MTVTRGGEGVQKSHIFADFIFVNDRDRDPFQGSENVAGKVRQKCMSRRPERKFLQPWN